jgi:hypothetical protein
MLYVMEIYKFCSTKAYVIIRLERFKRKRVFLHALRVRRIYEITLHTTRSQLLLDRVIKHLRVHDKPRPTESINIRKVSIFASFLYNNRYEEIELRVEYFIAFVDL